jgi:hypothetical protein
MVVLAVFIPSPTETQWFVFRVTLSAAAAGIAAVIPGLFALNMRAGVRAGGAIALFGLVFWFNPPRLFSESPPPSGTIRIGSMFFIINLNLIGDQYEKAHGEPLRDQETIEKIKQIVTWAQKGNYREAVMLLEGIEQEVDIAAIANNLAVLHASIGDIESARKDIQRAREKSPSDEILKLNEQSLDKKTPNNLLAIQNGGQVMLAPDDNWWKTIDGKEESSGLVFHTDQSAVYAFKDERPATFDAFAVLVPRSGDNLKEFELFAGNESPTGKFDSIGKFTVVNAKFMKSPYQEFKFQPVKAKYLKVLLLSSYHFNNFIELFEFRLDRHLS